MHDILPADTDTWPATAEALAHNLINTARVRYIGADRDRELAAIGLLIRTPGWHTHTAALALGCLGAGDHIINWEQLADLAADHLDQQPDSSDWARIALATMLACAYESFPEEFVAILDDEARQDWDDALTYTAGR